MGAWPRPAEFGRLEEQSWREPAALGARIHGPVAAPGSAWVTAELLGGSLEIRWLGTGAYDLGLSALDGRNVWHASGSGPRSFRLPVAGPHTLTITGADGTSVRLVR